MKRKTVSILSLLLICISALQCRSTPQVKDSFATKKPITSDLLASTITVFSYCNKDSLSMELTQQLITAMTNANLKVTSYKDLKNKIPSYPEDFFLDKPWMDKDNILTTQNIQTIASASKKISTEYILFVIIGYEYSSSNFYGFINTENSEIITRSYLIEKSTSQIAAYFVRKFRPHSKGFIGNPNASVSRMDQIVSDSFKLTAEDYTNYLMNCVAKIK